jgi:hypothetical protein
LTRYLCSILALVFFLSPIAALAHCRHPGYVNGNAAAAAGCEVEAYIDSHQSATIQGTGPGGTENNPLVPKSIVVQYHKDDPTGGFLLGTALCGGAFLLARCWNPIFFTLGDGAEAYNISRNAYWLRLRGDNLIQQLQSVHIGVAF